MTTNVEHLRPTAICTKCGVSKPSNFFRIDRSKPRGRDTQCKECTKERDAEKVARNAAQRVQSIADGHRKNCRISEAGVRNPINH